MPAIPVALARVLPALLLAAVAPAAAQQWTMTISPPGVVVPCSASDPSCLATGKVNVITGATANVTASCVGGADCGQVTLQLEQGGAVTRLGPVSGTGTSTLVFSVPASAVGAQSNLAVLYGGAKVQSFAMGAPGATPPPPSSGGETGGGGGGGGGDDHTLADLLRACQSFQLAVRPSYDAEADRGEVVVDVLGNLLAPLPEDFRFDEDDELRVWVVGADTLLPILKVERTSAFRDPTTVRILGAGETVPLIERQAAVGCAIRDFLVDDFAPGEGQVSISMVDGASLTKIGGFSIQVNPLYRGMLTLGAALSDLVDPGFRLVSDGQQTIIGLGDSGQDDLLYALFYTPFVWGPRDLQKPIAWYERLNPSLGVAVDDLADNAFLALSADLPGGFLLSGGIHFRRVTVLAPDAGLGVGSPFSGTADQIPTADDWDDDTFFALTVDLRAMVQFIRAAGGS